MAETDIRILGTQGRQRGFSLRGNMSSRDTLEAKVERASKTALVTRQS